MRRKKIQAKIKGEGVWEEEENLGKRMVKLVGGQWHYPHTLPLHPGPSCSKAGYCYPPDKSLSSGEVSAKQTMLSAAL